MKPFWKRITERKQPEAEKPMRPFDLLGTARKEFAEAMSVVDANRLERKRLKTDRSLNDSIADAYEQVDRTSGCMELPR